MVPTFAIEEFSLLYKCIILDELRTIMVLKTGPDRPVRPVGPLAGHRSGPVQSLDWMETEPGLDRLNRPVQVNLIFFFKASNDVVFVAYISKIKTSNLQASNLSSSGRR